MWKVDGRYGGTTWGKLLYLASINIPNPPHLEHFIQVLHHFIPHTTRRIDPPLSSIVLSHLTADHTRPPLVGLPGERKAHALQMQSYTALLQSYHELNSQHVDELPNEPSPLEFMRYVARNRPFVVRNAARQWPAVRKWNVSYLKQAMGDQEVNIAVTPFG